MGKPGEPTIQTKILTILYEQGSMTSERMAQFLPHAVKTLHSKVAELHKLKLVNRTDDTMKCEWSLVPGVGPKTLETGERIAMTDMPSEAAAAAPTSSPVVEEPRGIVLDQRALFKQQMINIGVIPKEAIHTITDIFFSGDINSITWLRHVLSQEAAGYVTPHQMRLMLSWWASTRQLDYKAIEEDVQERRGAKQPSESTLDPGLGWMVSKDKDGDWIPFPGGPLNYAEALGHCEKRALLSRYGAAEEGEPSEEGQPRRTARPPSPSPPSPQDELINNLLKGMVDNFFSPPKGGGDNSEVKGLVEKIDRMEKERQDERFSRIEAMISNVASQDHKAEFEKWRLETFPPVSADDSASVRLIKDATDKADKNVNRLAGMFERYALKLDEFQPEETRSEAEREQKAGELLGRVQSQDHSRTLRRRAFGK